MLKGINLWEIINKDTFLEKLEQRLNKNESIDEIDVKEILKELENKDLKFDFSQVKRDDYEGAFVFKLNYKGKNYKIISSFGSCDFCDLWQVTEKEKIIRIQEELEDWVEDSEDR